MAECPHESHDITYKLLSSQHTRRVNDVIMPFFLTAPRSHGPYREKVTHHLCLVLNQETVWSQIRKPQNTSGGPRRDNTSRGEVVKVVTIESLGVMNLCMSVLVR
jgi:hypothetical protein